MSTTPKLVRTSLNLSELDVQHLEETRNTLGTTKTRALSYSVTVGNLVATGEARLVGKDGKPLRIVHT
jgi:hypothetical protein